MPEATPSKSPGKLVAEILTSAWRSLPEPIAISIEDMASVVPLLNASGAGSLAWWRIKNSNLCDAPESAPLLDAYRFHTLQAIIQESNLKKVFTLYRSNGIDPILIKGWAIARHYAEPGLRLYGDIDLCVLPEQYEAALEVKKSPEACRYPIDLHKGFDRLDESPAGEVYARSRRVKIGDVEARVPGPEDHLRILCLHTLRHGAIRPIWLCDIAAALESKPPDFDWGLCLGKSSKKTDWIACAVGLAHRLLGARVGNDKLERRDLPGWLTPTVIKQWGIRQRPQGIRTPMAEIMRRPSDLPAAIRLRWPNPIEATVDINGAFNEWPRLPFQLTDCVARTARFLFQRKE
jgi:hypothetical protein